MTAHVQPEVLLSIKHKMVVVPTSEAIKNLFPQSASIQVGGVAHSVIPHRPTESFMLRTMGLDVPAPVLAHYEWPGLYKPFYAQEQTAALLTMNRRAYVLNSMGTGKTSAALWSWDYLYENKITGKLLVICPLSTMRFTWLREVFQTLPHRKAVALHGSKAKRLKLLAEDHDIYVINHDGAKLLEPELIARKDITTICIDELAVYRNASARTKSMARLAASKEWVWGMTGSPMPHSPTDVYSQAKIVTPDRVPQYFGGFRDKLMIKSGPFKFVPRAGAIEMAFDVMQPAVRFTLDDVVELPELVMRTQDVEMGPKQTRIYKELAAKCLAATEQGEITAANAGAVMMKLLQVSTGWVYNSEKEVVPLDGDQRISALLEAIEECDQKVLVFVPFIHALDGISKALAGAGIDHACVSGQTPLTERSETFNLFQNTDKYKVIVAHPQCLAHGITLTAATLIVWFAPVTSLEIYEQANARIRRVGQKNKQLVLHLQSTPVEKKIYKLLQANQQVQNSFLDMFADSTNANPLT